MALAVKRLSGAYALHIQNPKVPARLFDLVAAPVHDNFEGPNVITTFGAVHGVTPERLAEAGKSFAPRIADLPHPRVAVLLGGESQAFSFPPEVATGFGAKLATLARETGGSLLVTPSRRTRPETLDALTKAIGGVPHFVVGRHRRQSLFRLPVARRCHRRHRGLASTWSPRRPAPASRSMCRRSPGVRRDSPVSMR